MAIDTMTVSRRSRGAVIAAVVGVMITGLSAAAARAADTGFAITTGVGWHAGEHAQARVAVSDGRVWTASLKGARSPVATDGGVLEVVSRRLDGRDEWRWRQPVPSVGNATSLTDVQLDAIAATGGRLFVQALRCGPPNDDVAHGAPPAACEGTGTRLVTYDARSGALLGSTPPDGATGLAQALAGTSYLFTRTAGPDGQLRAVLQDPLSGAMLPRPLDERLGVASATSIAGPFYGSYADTEEQTLAVVDARTGRTDHTVRLAALYAKTGAKRPSTLTEVVPSLQPDGSLAATTRPDLPDDPPFKRGFYPAFVDRTGRAVRVGRKLDAHTVSAVAAGSRVIVSAESGTVRRKGRTLRRCSGVWLTTPSGARGAEVSGSGALRVSGAPVYWDGSVGVWERQVARDRYRVVVRRLSGTALRAAGRPRCRAR